MVGDARKPEGQQVSANPSVVLEPSTDFLKNMAEVQRKESTVIYRNLERGLIEDTGLSHCLLESLNSKGL